MSTARIKKSGIKPPISQLAPSTTPIKPCVRLSNGPIKKQKSTSPPLLQEEAHSLKNKNPTIEIIKQKKVNYFTFFAVSAISAVIAFKIITKQPSPKLNK